MTRDDLTAKVADVLRTHDQLVRQDAANVVLGHVGVPMNARPPNDAEVEILTLDKCVATADALGIVSEPDDWTPVGRGVFRFDAPDVSYVFDDGITTEPHTENAPSSGVRVVAPDDDHAADAAVVVSAEDVVAAVAEITQTPD